MNPQGRTALVTGGAHRLGRAFALALGRAGANVVVHYHGSRGAAHETVAELEAMGVRAAALQADLSDPATAAPLIAAVVDRFGGLDILVNSAATFERATIAEIDVAAWDHVQAVNVRAPFLLAQAAAPQLRTAGGVVVNIVDLSALQPWSTYAHHSVSKAGLLQLTRVLARFLGPEARACAIAPGTVLPAADDDGQDSAGTGPERRVLSRAGSPDDVTRALLYLVESDFVTGELLVVDGGRMLL